MQIKIHESYRNVVALCDSNLLGRKFEEGKFQLKIKENFFKGQEVNETEAVKTLQAQSEEDATFNIVGKKSTKAAIKAGIITKENIMKIQGVPLALTLL